MTGREQNVRVSEWEWAREGRELYGLILLQIENAGEFFYITDIRNVITGHRTIDVSSFGVHYVARIILYKLII